MKRCPECGREYDTSMMFCLDDGAELLYGPAPAADAPTAIMHSAADPRQAPTRAQIHTTARAEVEGEAVPDAGSHSKKRGLENLLLPLTGLLLVLALGGIMGYRYFNPAGSEQIDSIAVMPFVNASGNVEMEYLSDGMTETLINGLSQLPDLKVMSRSSVFRYKGRDFDAKTVASDLNVKSLLTGWVEQRGDALSINVELIDPRDNSQIWGRQYNRKLTDIFSTQQEIAKDIAENLRLKLSGPEKQQLAKSPTENLKAFQYYMQGRTHAQRRIREDMLTAIGFYERAIEEDHNYALAYTGLADAFANLGAYGYISPAEGRSKAEAAALRALELDENLAAAHATLGEVYVAFAPSDFARGDAELLRAIELSPSLALAHQYLGVSFVRRGLLDEASAEFRKARELDPLSSVIARVEALPYYLKRDHTRALAMLRQANELGPAFSQTWEIGVYIQNHLYDETLAELEKAKRERKGDPLLIYGTGMVYAAQSKRGDALQVIKELEEMSGPGLSQAHWIAKVYSSLNEKDIALNWLDRGLAAGGIGFFYKDEPVWDPIRTDPRFVELLRRMGLPQ
jgi:TolB-like protein